jgi:uncharacterized membrane protein YoaK (UPF0700 family)
MTEHTPPPEDEPGLKRMRTNYMAVGTAVGAGVGAALGVAMDDIGLWLPTGVAIGVAMGLALDAGSNKKSAGKK